MLDVGAVGERGAEAREHEQRVVHTDADPEQAGDGGSELGHVDDVREDGDERRRDPQADERDRERQAGGHDRPEGDEQHDGGREQADALGPTAVLGHPDDVAAERHGQAIAAGALGQGEQLLAGVIREIQGAAVQLERGGRDRAVARDPRWLGAADALDALGARQEAVDARADRWRAGAPLGLPGDEDRVA